MPARALPLALVLAVAAGTTGALSGCHHGGARDGSEPGALPAPSARRDTPPPPDPVGTFRRMGLIAQGGEFPLTGRVGYLASAHPDTTFVVLTLALPSRALTFTHGGDRYRGGYEVRAVVRRGADSTAGIQAHELVVVPTFRETSRNDESILFQQVLRLGPGSYQLLLRLRDDGSERTAADTMALVVPRLSAGTLGTPLPYYQMVVRGARGDVPRLLVTPRGVVTFGRDSVLPVYVEGYGSGEIPVRAVVRGEGGVTLWRDSARLEPHDDGLATAVLQLPVAALGIGAVELEVSRDGGAMPVRSPLLVTFGEDLPAASFDDMLSYLRFFAAPARLERLRRAPADQRGTLWAEFLASTDPDPSLAGNQALQQYFARIQVANQRYRDEAGPGWLSDRGMVFVALGDPEQILEPNPLSGTSRNRAQLWIYRDQQLQLEFRDVTGFDRWQLVPSGEVAFRSALARLRAQ